MLIYAKLFGAENRRFPVEIKPTDSVGDFENLVNLLAPGLTIRKLLFSGRVLSDTSARLLDCNVHKECVIQVMVAPGKSGRRGRRDTIPVSHPGLNRQRTMQQLQFGDVVLIQLNSARDLVDPQADTCNPYVVLSYSDQKQTSSVATDSEDPDWHEAFGFHLGISDGQLSDENITLDLYNRDLKASGHDGHLGTAVLPLSEILRDTSTEKVVTLENNSRDSPAVVLLTLYRTSLVAGHVVKGLESLIAMNKPWAASDLKAANLSMTTLVGEEPFSFTDSSLQVGQNPISYLHKQLLEGELRLENMHTAAKARKILTSQKAVLTQDEICRYLCFTDLTVSSEELQNLLGPKDYKNIAYYTNAHTGNTAFVTFASKEAALTNLLSLKTKGVKGSVCFGKQRLPVDEAGNPLVLDFIEGLLCVSTNKFRDEQAAKRKRRNGDLWMQSATQDKGIVGWARLQQGKLELYKRLSDNKPEITVDLEACDVERQSSKILSLTTGHGENEELIEIRSSIPDGSIVGWYDAMEQAKQDKMESTPKTHEQIDPIDGKPKPLSCFYRPGNSNQSQTYESLFKQFNKLYDAQRFGEITQDFSTIDLIDILSNDAYDKYLEASLDFVITQAEHFLRCPKCSTAIEVVRDHRGVQPEAEAMLKRMEDIHGNPLSMKAKELFCQDRLLCRNQVCLNEFCSRCGEAPYHVGLTCEENRDMKNAPRCRFCRNVIPNYKNKKIDSTNKICDQEDCIASNKIVSKDVMACGHINPGLEGFCTPCLEADCEDRPTEVNATLDEACAICYSELYTSPVVALDCSHVYHFSCLEKILQKGWPREYITFAFCSCPQCHKPFWHPAVFSMLKDVKKLQAQVVRDGLKKFKQEGYDKHPSVVDKNGNFYKNPIGFCNHHYAFYQCHECKQSYFGGDRACGAEDNTDEINREDLVCGNCQNVDSVEECPSHGRQYIAFKCRYCCKLSVFHCWGKVHFCVDCHKSEVWDKLTTYATGQNKKDYEDYPQCKEIRKQMDALLAQPKWQDPKNREELDKLMFDMHSTPETCDLNIRHRPNGYEFGLGCTMCADNETEEDNRRAREKAENEAKARMAGLMQFMDKIPNPKKFTAEGPMDQKGILYFFGTFGLTQTWQNPAVTGMVLVSGSQLMKDSDPIVGMVGRELVRCVTIQDQSNPWFSIDFVDKYVRPSAYMLRHYSSWDTECLRNWVFEGSIDGERWVTLRQHDNDESLSKKGQAMVWNIEDITCYFRKFRVKQTGPNSNLHNYLACSGFELYGDLHKTYKDFFKVAFEEQLERQVEKQKKDRVNFWTKLNFGSSGSFTFLYESDFDEQGIIWFMGTKGGTEPFKNPEERGLVHITSIGTTKDSEPAKAIVGRKIVRCVTQPVENAWFCLDFVDKLIQPTLYTLRHYSSWDTECLRNWVLEGSNDGRRWEVVMRHINDTSIQEKGASHTWPIPTQTRFSKWRIRQTGLNSNKHKYLACSGVEFYGKVYTMSKAPNPGPTTSELDHIMEVNYDGNDFGTSGLFYLLGTNFKRDKWKNPEIRNLVKVTASSICPDSEKANAMVGRTVVRCVTKPQENSWFCVDLKDYRMCPTAYSLRHYSSWDVEALRNWVFEGSTDNQRWNILGTYLNDQSLNVRGAARTWLLKKSNIPYRYFRVRQIGPNSNKHLYLSCSGMELYGQLHRVKNAGKPRKSTKQGTNKPGPSRRLPLSEKENLRKHLEAGKGLAFRYHSDLDENGIMYFLGTDWKTAEWKNPALLGVVNVSSSRLAKDSVPAYSVAGRGVVRCVCFPERQNWFLIDFKDKYLRPSRYTLRHYSSWETEALRNWVLEGSVDLQKFQILREHRNDPKLYGIGATATWKLDVKGRYRAFRIRQFGLNSNNHLYLSLSGFEIYGEMYFHPK